MIIEIGKFDIEVILINLKGIVEIMMVCVLLLGVFML